MIHDGSLDRSPQLLDQLAKQHPGLNVIHRPRNAGGGKSGALNTALAQLRGDWLLVLDADAQLQEDVLERLLPYAVGGGVMELRGNGQLLSRRSLEVCGGFNEETVTDDLDLSFRLLTEGSRIGLLWDPPVQEEAVESVPALWKQRQCWAEGGLQRFFDYWPLSMVAFSVSGLAYWRGCRRPSCVVPPGCSADKWV
ncbi:Glycosyl transferase family 2 [Synechococcus sp. WH 8101]|nr:Glycosyl transferase family 2 [Synechococcus sp. WH 8101]QNI43888.1 putative monoglycosyldiacylglycerol synthase [Synechococcus sp. WH 8101]